MLIQQLLFSYSPESRAYAEQLPRLTVVSRCACGCPTLHLAVDGRTALQFNTDIILGEAGGISPEGRPFGIILHGRDGLISELEVYPTGNDAPFTLLSIDQIDFYPED